MAFNWNKFPWTNLHELNLDWIIQTVKKLENKVLEFGNQIADVVGKLSSITDDGTDFTINATGDVNIEGDGIHLTAKNDLKAIRASGKFYAERGLVSNGECILTDGSASMNVEYSGNGLQLLNNQHPESYVLVHGIADVNDINPALSTDARKNFAASCGYVDSADAVLKNAIDAEAETRRSEDERLQGAVDVVANLERALSEKVDVLTPTIISGRTDTNATQTQNVVVTLSSPIEWELLTQMFSQNAPLYFSLTLYAGTPEEQINRFSAVSRGGFRDGRSYITFSGVRGYVDSPENDSVTITACSVTVFNDGAAYYREHSLLEV